MGGVDVNEGADGGFFVGDLGLGWCAAIWGPGLATDMLVASMKSSQLMDGMRQANILRDHYVLEQNRHVVDHIHS